MNPLSQPDPFNGMHWFFALIAVCVLLVAWGYIRGKRAGGNKRADEK